MAGPAGQFPENAVFLPERFGANRAIGKRLPTNEDKCRVNTTRSNPPRSSLSY
jgi:hypothetical protein